MNNIDDILILKYLQGECRDSELAEINAWLDQSPENIKTLFDTEMAFRLGKIERYSEPEFVEKAHKRLMKKIEAERTTEIRNEDLRQNRTMIWRMTAAAAVIVVAIASSLIWNSGWNASDIVVRVLPTDTVRSVTLPDGSEVWLNKASTLRYPRKFAQNNRNVHLDGEGYFKVKHNQAAPFSVNSKAMQVTVLGTTFNLKASASNRFAEATLVNGEIQIKGNNDEGQIILAPNQTAYIDTHTRRMTVKSVNAKLKGVWHNNLIPFNDASIDEIMKTLEDLYRVQIHLSSRVNTGTRYSGVVSHKDSIEKVLNSLKNSIPICFRIDKDHNNIFVDRIE